MLQYAVIPFLTASDIRQMYEYNLVCPVCVQFREQQHKDEEIYWLSDKNLARALRFANDINGHAVRVAYNDLLTRLEVRIGEAKEDQRKQQDLKHRNYLKFLEQTDVKIKQLHSEALKKREARYREALEYGPNSDNLEHLQKANDGHDQNQLSLAPTARWETLLRITEVHLLCKSRYKIAV